MSEIDGWCSFTFQPCQSRFKAIFPDGLIIKKGGMASGLKKAETNEHEPKLFKVAGGIRPVMTEVSSVDKIITEFLKYCNMTKVPMAWSSMNHGDVFVLDSGKKIFVWRGAEASGSEKMAAGLIAAKLRDHVGEEITHLEDGEEEAECDEEWTEHLPLDGRAEILDKDAGNDAAITDNVDKTIELYK